MVDLGATVVSVEPQPEVASYLRSRFRRSGNVHIEVIAIGSEPGTLQMSVNRSNPTLSTLSDEAWKAQINKDARYRLSWRKED